MKVKIVHFTSANGGHSARCGCRSFWPVKLSYIWKKVTCKRCLKYKKITN